MVRGRWGLGGEVGQRRVSYIWYESSRSAENFFTYLRVPVVWMSSRSIFMLLLHCHRFLVSVHDRLSDLAERVFLPGN